MQRAGTTPESAVRVRITVEVGRGRGIESNRVGRGLGYGLRLRLRLMVGVGMSEIGNRGGGERITVSDMIGGDGVGIYEV